jgi:hypothetical protein
MTANILIASSLFFVLIGAGLFALTLRKLPALPARPNGSQLREHAVRVAEMQKMRLAGGIMAGIAAIILLIALIS